MCGRQHELQREGELEGGPARSETPGMYGNTQHGDWEIPRSSAKAQTVSESLRTNPDDERSWEVGSIHSTGEAAEQCGQPRGGGSGGKGSSQGEPAQARQALDTEPGELAHRTGAGTVSSRTGQETTIHRASAPHLRYRSSATRVYG